MFYDHQSVDQVTVINDCLDIEEILTDLNFKHRIGPRIILKKKIARYLRKKKHYNIFSKNFMKHIVAKAKKIQKSYEKKERYLSKQIIKTAYLSL